MKDFRHTSQHSRAALPVGTLRLRWHKASRARRHYQRREIKYRDDGPYQAANWMTVARWTWLQNRGPIPRGKRVMHLDGDPLNDDLSNLALYSAADMIAAWHFDNPDASDRSYRAAAEATAAHNRQRPLIRAALGDYCPTRWYAVDHAAGVVIAPGFRDRCDVYVAHGVPAAEVESANGRGFVGPALGWPGVTDSGAACLAALIEGGAMTLPALAEAAATVMRPYGRVAPALMTSWHLFLRPLRLRGWLLVLGRGRDRRTYQATPAAILARRTPCPVIAVRGDALIAGERKYRIVLRECAPGDGERPAAPVFGAGHGERAKPDATPAPRLAVL